MNEITIYDHRGEPAELPRPARILPWWAPLPFLVIAFFALGYGVWDLGRREGRRAERVTVFTGSPTTTTFTFSTEYRDKPARVISDRKFVDALGYAVTEWQRALNRTITPPELLEAECTAGGIACVESGLFRPQPNAIRIPAGSMSGEYDWPSILMHELGHLLGVPHIEDDPLMAPQYAGPVKHPSKFAIAIARTFVR